MKGCLYAKGSWPLSVGQILQFFVLSEWMLSAIGILSFDSNSVQAWVFFRPYFHCYLSSFIIAKIAFMFVCIFLSRVDLRVQGHIKTFFVSLFLCFSFSFYFSFQFASSSKDMLDTFSVKCKCKNVWKRSFYAQIDDKSRCRGETLNRLHKLMLKRQMNKEGKFLKKLWCCVGGRV